MEKSSVGLAADCASAALAGVAYFGAVFSVGFAFGVVRSVVLAPVIGEAWAVALELPLILSVSWIFARLLIRKFNVAAIPAPRAVMGIAAFALLLTAEACLSLFVAGRTLMQHVELYRTTPALLGLAGQVAFAAFPLVQFIRDQQSRPRNSRG
jgi:hypothetical protein